MNSVIFIVKRDSLQVSYSLIHNSLCGKLVHSNLIVLVVHLLVLF